MEIQKLLLSHIGNNVNDEDKITIMNLKIILIYLNF